MILLGAIVFSLALGWLVGRSTSIRPDDLFLCQIISRLQEENKALKQQVDFANAKNWFSLKE